MDIGSVVLLILSAALTVSDLAVSAAYLLQGRAAAALSRAARVAVAERKGMDRVYTLAWLAAGATSLWAIRPPILMAVPLFLAFKSGADLGSRAVYARHDLSLLRGRGSLGGAVGRVLVLSAVPSALFLITWWIFGRTLETLASVWLGYGIPVGLTLWIAGVVFGVVFGVARSRGEEGVLLGGELALVAGSALAGMI